ncbi:MAG: VanZ family protein, partial [Acidobacteriota bacterium]
LAALTVATAPFLGELRDLLFDRFPGSAVKILAVVLGASALAIAAMAAYRIVTAADRRRLRLALAAIAAVVIVGQIFGFGTADPRTNVVEKVHIVQYGLLALLFYRALAGTRREGEGEDVAGPTRLVLPILWASLVGLLDESTQGFFQMRTGDIRDVAINALSSVSGLLLALALDPPHQVQWRSTANGLRRLADWTALLVLGTGLFIAELHLGTWIDDPQIGRFRSWFTAEQLADLAADRAQRWAKDPPTELVPWKPEDYYLTEAAWHASHRNERYRAGDFTLARQANRILEAYYGPFLDLHSFRGAGIHRYPPAVLEQLDQNALPIDPSSYESPVLAQRLRTWPSARPFRLAILAFAALLAALPRLDRRRR